MRPLKVAAGPVGTAVAAAVIVVSVVAAYLNGLRAPFELDDFASIPENASIRTLWPLSVPLSPPATGTTVGGRPVANLTLALNHALGGDGVMGYHAVNILIHALAALALFGVVRRTLAMPALQGRFGRDALPLALAAALLWALHPLLTESVTYVIQRVESLMGLFYLLTLYCLIRSVDSGRSAAWQAGAITSCLLGMATKEVMVTAPLAALLYDRTFISGSFREALRRRPWLYACLGATWLLLGVLVARTGWSRGGSAGFTGWSAAGGYWLAQSQAAARYLGLSLWPHPLVFDYGTVILAHPRDSALCALLMVPLAAATLYMIWRRPVPGFLAAWFFLILAPSSLIPVATQTMAEHRMYLPLGAVVVSVVLGSYRLLGRRAFALLGAFAVGLGLLTCARNEDYRSAASLWGAAVASEPDNARARCALGSVLRPLPGRLPDAVAQLREAVRLDPGYALAHNELGIALQGAPGASDEAIGQFREALRIDPNFAIAHNNLGLALAQSGKTREAIDEFEAAVREKRDYAEALSNLGVALCISGRTGEGIEQLKAAIRTNPDLATTRLDLGSALLRQGRRTEAAAEFEAVLRLTPDDPKARMLLERARGGR
jgi:tetratricopeptide (TPR) repeat protein